MSWKNLFITGFILTLSPFSFKAPGYVFLYSVLGYGLVLVSYLFKEKIKKEDYLFIFILVLIVFSGLLNVFLLYLFLPLVFFLFLFYNFYFSSKNELVRTLSFYMTGVSGLSIAVFLGGWITPGWLSDLSLFLYYFNWFMTLSAFFLENRKKEIY